MSVSAGQAGARVALAKRNKMKTQHVSHLHHGVQHHYGGGDASSSGAVTPLLAEIGDHRSEFSSRVSRPPSEPTLGVDALVQDALLAAQANMCRILEEWSSNQRALHAEQERLTERLLHEQTKAAENMRRLRGASGGSTNKISRDGPGRTPSGVPSARELRLSPGDGGQDAGEAREERATGGAVRADRLSRGIAIKEEIAKNMQRFEEHDEELDFWRKTSGLHTVDKWVLDYKNHPGAWGALLMIHGVAELTSRLRTKVENFAIYSALFLSMSIALLAAPADHMVEQWEKGHADWASEASKRFYIYGLTIGTAAHMLCIALAMSFVNALNETARDSDVYRMLSRGQGFMATLKCQYAFGLGCLADFVSVSVTTTTYGLSWQEPLIMGLLILAACGVVYHRTSTLLFTSGSLINYWRKELGGNPDPTDPYDLFTPASCFYEKASMNDAVWEPKGERFSERCGAAEKPTSDLS